MKYQGNEKRDPFLDPLLSIPLSPIPTPGWKREFGIKCPLPLMAPGSGAGTEAPWVLSFLTFVKLSFYEC